MHNKIILADDHFVFRTGMARILSVEDDIRIVAQCDKYASLVKSVASFPDAIIILGASLLPERNALPEVLRATNSRAIVVIENEATYEDFLRQGIRGVVYRKMQGGELITCVRLVSRGELYMPKVSKINSELLDRQDLGKRVLKCLTPKELLVLSFVIRGRKNKQIAAELRTSEQVVKNYLSNIFNKTGTSDRLELALFTLHNTILAQAATRVVVGCTPC